MANIAKGDLSNQAKVFDSSLYSKEISTNTEQALKSRQWRNAMEEEMRALIKNNTWEKCVLPPGKKTVRCRWVFTIKYKPDGDDKEEITKLKKNLFTEFEMKDLENLKYFLGIEVLRSKQGKFMHQRKYVCDLLAETGMIDCKPVEIPMIMNQKLSNKETTDRADKGRYQRMVGKLIYLSHTRPDIAYAVGVDMEFYSNQTVILKLSYTPMRIGPEIKTTESTSGYFTLVGGNLVTWRSKKQKVVALSSAEAEFRGIARGISEVLWVRKLLTEIGYPPQESSKVLSDNKASIQISENHVQHDRTKHIEVDRHFIKEKLETKIITLYQKVTKAVNERSLHECLGKLNFGNLTIQLEGEC
ncbi:putative RNA-directed DNA polymerase [Tanacetum coccineum]